MSFMTAVVSDAPDEFLISDDLEETIFCKYNNINLPVGVYERDEDRSDDDVANGVAYVFDRFPKMGEFKIIFKYWGQLTAPGYMDQTDYVLGDTQAEVAQQLLDMYFDGEDEYMDDEERADRDWLLSIVDEEEKA